jgi:hypothetical protein
MIWGNGPRRAAAAFATPKQWDCLFPDIHSDAGKGEYWAFGPQVLPLVFTAGFPALLRVPRGLY